MTGSPAPRWLRAVCQRVPAITSVLLALTVLHGPALAVLVLFAVPHLMIALNSVLSTWGAYKSWRCVRAHNAVDVRFGEAEDVKREEASPAYLHPSEVRHYILGTSLRRSRGLNRQFRISRRTSTRSARRSPSSPRTPIAIGRATGCLPIFFHS